MICFYVTVKGAIFDLMRYREFFQRGLTSLQ